MRRRSLDYAVFHDELRIRTANDPAGTPHFDGFDDDAGRVEAIRRVASRTIHGIVMGSKARKETKERLLQPATFGETAARSAVRTPSLTPPPLPLPNYTIPIYPKHGAPPGQNDSPALPCVFADGGCTEIHYFRDLLQRHEGTCEFQPGECKFLCSVHGLLRKHLPSHYELCPNRPCACPSSAARPDAIVPCRHECGVHVKNKETTQHENDCPQRPVVCPLGCHNPAVRFCQLEHHMLHLCPDRIVTCTHECGIEDLRFRHHHQHKEEECPRRPIRCDECGIDHPACSGVTFNSTVCPQLCPWGCQDEVCLVDMPAHQEACPKRKTSCPNHCGPVLYIELAEHLRHFCTKRVIDCPYECGHTIFTGELQEHKQHCGPYLKRQFSRCEEALPPRHEQRVKRKPALADYLLSLPHNNWVPGPGHPLYRPPSGVIGDGEEERRLFALV
jgi:hypothetical protein